MWCLITLMQRLGEDSCGASQAGKRLATRVTVSVDQRDYEQLTTLAEEYRVSLAWLGRWAVADLLERADRQDQLELPSNQPEGGNAGWVLSGDWRTEGSGVCPTRGSAFCGHQQEGLTCAGFRPGRGGGAREPSAASRRERRGRVRETGAAQFARPDEISSGAEPLARGGVGADCRQRQQVAIELDRWLMPRCVRSRPWSGHARAEDDVHAFQSVAVFEAKPRVVREAGWGEVVQGNEQRAAGPVEAPQSGEHRAAQPLSS